MRVQITTRFFVGVEKISNELRVANAEGVYKVRSGDVTLQKVLGAHNPWDALTKYLSGPELRAHLEVCMPFDAHIDLEFDIHPEFGVGSILKWTLILTHAF